MIKKEFWEKVAFSWSKIDKTDIPVVEPEDDIPDDFFEENEIEDMDDLLRELMNGNNIDLEDEEIEGVSVIRVDYYNYEEADEFAKLHGDGIEKYQITGLKDDKKQKLINDNLSNIYEETLEEYKNHISTEYLPSLQRKINPSAKLLRNFSEMFSKSSTLLLFCFVT